MTLDEAINHCLEVAKQNDTQAEKWQEEGGEQWGKTTACRECAADHRQLAEWLKDYKLLRGEYFKCQLNSIDDYRREAARCRAAYFSLSSAHSHLTIRQTDTYQELQEAKRLLKLAVEDFVAIAEVHAAATPILCPQYGKYMKAIDVRTRKWQYADEAEKLLNGEK